MTSTLFAVSRPGLKWRKEAGREVPLLRVAGAKAGYRQAGAMDQAPVRLRIGRQVEGDGATARCCRWSGDGGKRV